MTSRITKLIGFPIFFTCLLINVQTARATCSEHGSFFCRFTAWGGWKWPSPIIPNPEERLKEIQALKTNGLATAADYLEEGYLNSQIGNYSGSQESFTQGLQLTERAGDLKGQALALEGLGMAFIKVGNTKAARVNLTQARSFYRQLGKSRLVNEMSLHLIKIPNQK